MNIQRHLGWTVVLIGLLPFFAAPALAASTYRIEQLPQYSADYPTASPGAINKNGIVVGSASSINTDSGESKALLWNEAGVLSDISAGSLYATAIDINDLGQTLLYLDGVFFILDQGTRMPLAVGNNSIYFNAINNAGQVTGWFTSNGQPHAVLYANGVATDLGTLSGGTYSYGYGINGRGQVVGMASNASGQSRAVLWSNGAIVDLGILPGHTYSVARSINDAGQVVGYSGTGYPTYSSRAFLWENGVMTDLGSVGSNDVVTATKINNAGQIIGNARMAGLYRSTAFVWTSGGFTNLNPIIGNTTNAGCYAMAINDVGQITGICDSRVFRLSPTADAVDVGVDIVTNPSYQVYQGSPLTYSIVVTNTGSLPATNVSVVDVLPTQMNFQSVIVSQGNCSGTTTISCALGDLAVGATATVQLTVIPNVTGYNIENAATVSADADVNSANNRATATNTVYPPLVLADVGVSVTTPKSTVLRRSNITYTVTVKNNGPDIAKEVLLSDSFSSNPVTLVSYSVSRGSCSLYPTKDGLRCSLGDMTNGEIATLTVTVKPVYSFVGLTYTNSASISTKSTDQNSVNNYASSTVTVK